jgi:hypothetical protein
MTERDFQLLAILEPADRSVIEEVVDEVIAETLGASDPELLRAAAEAFDKRAEEIEPLDERLVALQIAAALRVRADPEAGVQFCN